MTIKATATLETETVVVKKTVEEKRVKLSLSINEAETLMGILASIGGGSKNSRRMHTDSIAKALESVGIDSKKSIDAMEFERSNTIFFKDELSHNIDWNWK